MDTIEITNRELAKLIKNLCRNREALHQARKGEVNWPFIWEELDSDAERGYFRWHDALQADEIKATDFQITRATINIKCLSDEIRRWAIFGSYLEV